MSTPMNVCMVYTHNLAIEQNLRSQPKSKPPSDCWTSSAPAFQGYSLLKAQQGCFQRERWGLRDF